MANKSYKAIHPGARCVIENCFRAPAAGKRGMCLVCYSKAKKKVDSGEVTWDRLEEMGMCLPEDDPFDDAYNKAMEDE
jgi:hypothetical protein